MAKTNAPRRRTLPRTAAALAKFIVQQQARATLFPPRNPERVAISAVLHEVVRKAPWQALDRFVARAHNATLAGAVTFIASQLKGERRVGFPRRGLAKSIAGGCSDLHTNLGGERDHPRRRTLMLQHRVSRALGSKAIRRILFGRIPGEPHGAIAGAEYVVSLLTGVARSTVQAARGDLRKSRP